MLSIDPVLTLLAHVTCSAAANPKARKCLQAGCDQAVAETFGVTRRAVVRWKLEGLTIWQADELATRLLAHPAHVWGPRAWARAQRAHEAFSSIARVFAST